MTKDEKMIAVKEILKEIENIAKVLLDGDPSIPHAIDLIKSSIEWYEEISEKGE